MKKQLDRKKLALTTETVRQMGASKLGEVAGAGTVLSATAYGVVSCGTTGSLHCHTNDQ